MRRAALSSNAITLPSSPSSRPADRARQIVRGRQTVVRHGIFFIVVAKNRRSAYQQLDGEIILVDECKCLVNWPEGGGPFGLSFEISRTSKCPINEHQKLALNNLQDEEDL